MAKGVQLHRRRIVHIPAPVQNGYGSGSYVPPAQAVADIRENPLIAVACAMYGPRPNARYGSSSNFRPLKGTERALRDAATQYKQGEHPVLSAVARAGYSVIKAVDDVAGPAVGIVAVGTLATIGGVVPLEKDSTGKTPEKISEHPDKEQAKVPIVKEAKEPVKVSEKMKGQEYKAPEKQEPVKTVAKGRGRAATEFFAGAGQVVSYVSAVDGGNADGSFDPSDRAQVQQVGPIAQYLAGVASAFKDTDPANGIFVQHWWNMQQQMKSNVTQDLSGAPGGNCGQSVDEGGARYNGAHKALEYIAAMKALAGKAGLDINGSPAQKPGNYLGVFGWEVSKSIRANEAATNKALQQGCTVDKSEAYIPAEDIGPGVDTLAKLAQAVDGLKQWVDKEPTGLGPVSPWVAGVDNLGKVYTGALARASAQALVDGIGLAKKYNDAGLGIDQVSDAFAGLVPFNLPPTIEGLALDSAVPAYLGFEPILKGNMRDPDGKGIRSGQVQVGDDIADLPVSGKVTEKIEYALKNLRLGNNKVLVRAGDSAWVVDTSMDVNVTDPAPTMDTWNSSVEKVSDGLYKVYVSAFLADDNDNIDGVRAVDVNGSGFNIGLEKTTVTKLENGKTFVRYEGVQNVRLKNPGDSKDLTLQLRYKDPTNPEVQAPNTERINVVYPKPAPPNPINNGTPNGTPLNNSTVIPPIVDNGDGHTEPPRDYRGLLAGLVALGGGGGAGIWQRRRIAAALGMGSRINGGNVRYTPLAGNGYSQNVDLTSILDAIVYVGPGGRVMFVEQSKRGNQFLSKGSRIDTDLAGGMIDAVLSGLGQVLGNNISSAVTTLADGSKARYVRGRSGDVLCIITNPKHANAPPEQLSLVLPQLDQKLEQEMEQTMRDIENLVPELKDWQGETSSTDSAGQKVNAPIVDRIAEVVRTRVIEGKDPVLVLQPLPQASVPPVDSRGGLLDAQGEAERPTGDIPHPEITAHVQPADGFGPPVRPKPRVVSDQSMSPPPMPTGVSDLLASTPAPPTDSVALRASVMRGMEPPEDLSGVGMHPGVPANGNGEHVDVEGILGGLGLGKGKGGAGR
ncbi:MAG: hypothetical protein HY362_02355 [Candidatus Aenigmarchaeota archaeon]|nr:hypothetical protein [Candidatus Aenigmarchaeota archaeon]